jgi:hypothetical protein
MVLVSLAADHVQGEMSRSGQPSTRCGELWGRDRIALYLERSWLRRPLTDRDARESLD